MLVSMTPGYHSWLSQVLSLLTIPWGVCPCFSRIWILGLAHECGLRFQRRKVLLLQPSQGFHHVAPHLGFGRLGGD